MNRVLHGAPPLAMLWAKCGAPATFPREAEALAYCQVEAYAAYADDPPASPPRALLDLVGVLQCLLDLQLIDDATGDLKRWSAQWGYVLHFRPPAPAECS